MHRTKGLLAIFDHPDDLIAATQKVREVGITKLDAFTPFAIHGLNKALRLKRSWIPWTTLVIAVSGWCLGFFFQAWTHAIDWPVNVGGKPGVSWPAFIPVTFEMMVLLSGVSTSLILLAICWPFDFWRSSPDPRLTCDRFGLMVDQRDPLFNEYELKKIFQEHDVAEIKHIA